MRIPIKIKQSFEKAQGFTKYVNSFNIPPSNLGDSGPLQNKNLTARTILSQKGTNRESPIFQLGIPP